MPEIDISGTDTIHLTWWEGSAVHKIPYRRSVDGGSTWESIKELALDSSVFPTSFNNKKLAVADNKVWIFSGGEGTPPGPGRMALSRSTDAGATWMTERTAFPGTTNIKSASVSGDTMAVVYMPSPDGLYHEPRLIYSTDNGNNWTMHPDTFKYWTMAALTPGVLHMVMSNVVDDNLEIQYLRSTNLGQTFEPAVTLSPSGDERGGAEPDLVAKHTSVGNQIGVTWRDEMECYGFVGCTILFRQSTDNGLTWEAITPLTEQARGYEPSVGISPGGRPAVVWSQEVEFMSPVHTHSRIEAANQFYWLPSVDHSAPAPASGAPDIALTEKAVHVVWGQNVPGQNPHWCLYYQRGEFIQPNQMLGVYKQGWNMLSVPLRKDTTYSCFTSVHAFEGGTYTPATTMEPGKGYWAKLDWPQVRFEGDSVLVDTVAVTKGWNMIGAISVPVTTTSIVAEPSGIVVSAYFTMVEGSYFPMTTIEPGRGYWVKVNQDGNLILRQP